MHEPAHVLTPLPQILRACADEIAVLATLGLRLEQTLSALAPMLQAREAVVEEMQGLDRLVQHAAALHALLLNTAANAPSDALLDMRSAVDAISLEDMNARLRSTLFAAAAPQRSPEPRLSERIFASGDLEIF
ncbi:MAG: hypothetical protein ABW199_01140 [Caulobacterales bacterium]